jgi:hypothetical protein
VAREPAPVVASEHEPEHEPELVAVAEPAPQPVVAVEPEPGPEPEPEPEPEAESTPGPEAVLAPPARRSFLPRPHRSNPAPEEPQPEPESTATPKEHRKPGARAARRRPGDAARDLVAAKARARAAKPGRRSATTAPPELAPVAPAEVEPLVASVPAKPAKVSKHDEVAHEVPSTYHFKPKRTSRRLLTIALLCGLVLSAYFIRAAVELKDTGSIGLAAIVLLATAMVWAIRAGASVTTLTVHHGQLEVVQQGGRYVFDMASQYTKVEVHGRPGKHGWAVIFPRRGMAPFKVDATMVDPDDFMRVLRFFRPQLANH